VLVSCRSRSRSRSCLRCRLVVVVVVAMQDLGVEVVVDLLRRLLGLLGLGLGLGVGGVVVGGVV